MCKESLQAVRNFLFHMGVFLVSHRETLAPVLLRLSGVGKSRDSATHRVIHVTLILPILY